MRTKNKTQVFLPCSVSDGDEVVTWSSLFKVFFLQTFHAVSSTGSRPRSRLLFLAPLYCQNQDVVQEGRKSRNMKEKMFNAFFLDGATISFSPSSCWVSEAIVTGLPCDLSQDLTVLCDFSLEVLSLSVSSCLLCLKRLSADRLGVPWRPRHSSAM